MTNNIDEMERKGDELHCVQKLAMLFIHFLHIHSPNYAAVQMLPVPGSIKME
jgi:hypothetical protein